VSLFGKRHPTDVELDKLAEDVKIQGMEGMHLIRMSAALELGRLPPISDVFGVLFYGSDIRMSEMAKKQRKAGIDTLQKILEKADIDVRATLAEHFANVVREYSAEGLVKDMDYERLAQSIPPDYGQLVFTQMCMAWAHAKFGVPIVTFDDFIQRPDESRRLMSRWLRGAGDERPEAALELVGPGGDQMIGSRTAEHSDPEG